MKATIPLVAALLAAVSIQAQQSSAGLDPSVPLLQSVATTLTNGVETVIRTPTDWNATWVQVMSSSTDDSGAAQTTTNRYAELGSGLNYISLDDGLLRESDPSFVLVTNEARAWTGQSQLSLAGNINSPIVLRARLPDGQALATRVQGLFIYDATTAQTIQLATVKDSIGVQTETNAILYPDCFDGGGAVTGDVLFVNTINGWSQDIVIHQWAVDGTALANAGLTNASTDSLTVEVWTEFVDSPTPQQTPVWAQGTVGGVAMAMPDVQLNFGTVMQMGTGRAFLLGQESDSVSLVSKQWVQTPDQRQFLVESAPLALIQAGMPATPQGTPGKAGAMLRPPSKSRLEAMNSLRPGKSAPGKVEASIRTLKTAGKGLLAWAAQPGLVLDYTTLGTVGLSNYVFLGDHTYYLSTSGGVTCTGTVTTVEGGCVIKSATNASLTIKTPLSWQATQFRPVIMCSKDEPSCGESVSGSTGYPGSAQYAAAALVLDASSTGATNTSFNLSHLRIANAQTGIQLLQGTNAHSISHAQFVYCGTAMAPSNTTFSLLNALIFNVGTMFGGSGTGSTADLEHLTVDGGVTFQVTNVLSSCGITNSLVMGITNLYLGTATNQVAVLGNNTGVFANLTSGPTHYLASGSPYRNLGTTAINPSLAADLLDLSTYPPTDLGTNWTVTANTVLSPQALRDTGVPDLGYHGDPCDYVVKGITVNGTNTLALLNGVSVAFYGTTGISFQNSNGKFTSFGLPESLNHLFLANAIFEQATNWITNTSSFTLVNLNTDEPQILRFTDVSFLSAGQLGQQLYPQAMSGAPTIQDCQLRGVYWAFPGTSGGAASGVVVLKNNYLERSTLSMSQYYPSTIYNLALTWQNNLFSRCALSLIHWGSSYGAWSVYDNVFDNSTGTKTEDGFVDSNHDPFDNFTAYGYNGFINTTEWLVGTGDHTNLLRDFVPGPLGSYYYPTSGATNSLATLIDADSARTAAGVGLAEYTTVLGQQKDTTNLDVGMHYAALEAHQASTEYSSTQGSNNWYYAKTTAPYGTSFTYLPTFGNPYTGYTNVWYDGTIGCCGGDYFAWVWSNGQHPAVDYDSLRIWQSPAAGKMSAWSSASTGASSDGVNLAITKNGGLMTPWTHNAPNGTVTLNGRTWVQTGDIVSFQLNMAANNSADATTWDPVIILYRGVSTLSPGLPDWFADSNGDGSVNSSDGTGDLDGDGVIDRSDPRPFDPTISTFQITIERPVNGSTVN